MTPSELEALEQTFNKLIRSADSMGMHDLAYVYFESAQMLWLERKQLEREERS